MIYEKKKIILLNLVFHDRKKCDKQMKLHDYLLTLLMEESSEVVVACSKIIRYGTHAFLSKDKEMTTENLLAHELIDCVAPMILLAEIGVNIMPTTVDALLTKEETILDIEYRLKTIFRLTKENTNLELDRDELQDLEDKVLAKIDEYKLIAKDKVNKKNYNFIVGQYQNKDRNNDKSTK